MIEPIIKFLKEKIDNPPLVGIVLGSGLQKIASSLDDVLIIQYSDIPSFINTTVDGHAGEFIIGKVNNMDIICANGRFHYYEGLSYENTHIIIDIFHMLGCQNIITTNSSGCLESSWKPGDLMVIDSHLDMTFRNEIDMIDRKYGDKYYNPMLYRIAIESMREMNLSVRTGTYGWTLGPTYETKAEIEFMQNLDIQAVGMSTVPEIERAHDLKIKLLGIACLTNYAVGISKNPLTHTEVIEQAQKSSHQFSELILNILKKISIS
tara:strand:- start:11916 stop:12707 length:792 start_codon:yes stop_codon:yes gene_type:complete